VLGFGGNPKLLVIIELKYDSNNNNIKKKIKEKATKSEREKG